MKIHSQIIVLVGLLLSSNHTLADITTAPKHADLSAELNIFLDQYANEIAASGYRSEFSVGNIDPRMNFKQCSRPWEFEFSRAPLKQSRTTVLAQCLEGDFTKLYISVDYEIFGEVIVSSRLISRGQAISAQDLKVQEQQINTARHATFRKREPVIGMIAKRSIKEGRPITPPLLAAPRLVTRGDDVMITASNSKISIRMSGEALSHGTLGQQISVRNKQSKRVIRARVTNSGQVEVVL